MTQTFYRQSVRSQSQVTEIEVDLSSENVNDSQLWMMFVICNPVISLKAQTGLALRIHYCFGIEEIAEAFLASKETINERLFRAKKIKRCWNTNRASCRTQHPAAS